MVNKGPIYKDEGESCGGELLKQLYSSIRELEESMKAGIPISRGGVRVGFGVSKAQKNIAAESVIAIAREIKSLRGW